MDKITTKTAGKYSHLCIVERKIILLGLTQGLKQYEIALQLSRSPSTISREINRNRSSIGKRLYRVSWAQYQAEERKKQSHKRERINQKKLRRFIVKCLQNGYSPEIIANMAKQENARWKINYETIYQWIYSERHDLIPFLTKSHKNRRKRGFCKQKRSIKIPNRTMIDKRLSYINLRSCIGHWEIDTAVSRQSKAAIMVLVERRTRFVIIKKLSSKTALCMHNATLKSLINFPTKLRQSITYDNGTENALHQLTNTKLKTESYFCNPYHSWEKGTVENRIGIIRQFFPKKTDWNNISQWELNKVSRYINNRPMKLLGFKTPYQVFVALAP
jgi:IS30 family transposase